MSVVDNHPRKIAAGSALAGATLAACVTLVSGFEGKRNYTYFDIVGVPTYCYGETLNAGRVGTYHDDQQCNAKLTAALRRTYSAEVACVPSLPTKPSNEIAAFISLGYNVGAGGICRSSIPRRLAAKEDYSGCERIRDFDRAGGRVVRGLTIRRNAEAALCEKGLKP